MATTPSPKNKKERSLPDQERISQYKSEYQRCLDVLDLYHTERFDRNYRQYTGFTSIKGSTVQVSDPVAPELVERVVQNMFQRPPKFYALSRGKNLPPEVTKVLSYTAEYMWEDPDMIQASGTMQAKLKMVGREFCVTGQAVTESFFNSKSNTPDVRIIPVEDVIFDPAATLKTSPFKYIRQYVTLDYLENLEEVEKDGKVVSGIFSKKAMDLLREKYKENQGTSKDDPTPNQVNRSGGSGFVRKVEPILLVSRWEGAKLCQIADWEVVLREADDPMRIGEDPFDIACDIEVPKEPYAFGLLDFLNGLTKAKDMVLAQTIDYGSKLLNKPIFVDPNIAPVNRATLSNAFKVGGIVFAAPNQVSQMPMEGLPPFAFDFMTYVQQRAEGVSGVSPYLGGVPNAANDKTQGTKGGTLALIQQAAAPVQDRQRAIEEGILEPMMNKWLKMAGALMGTNEEKYVMITGQNQQWIQVTKGLLTGKITLPDLVTAGVVDEMTASVMLAEAAARGETNPEKKVIYDADWIIKVEAGSMAEVDSQADLQNFDGWVGFCMQMGIPLDTMKVALERGIRSGVKEPDQFIQKPQAATPGVPGVPGIPPPGPTPGIPQGMPGQGVPQPVPQNVAPQPAQPMAV